MSDAILIEQASPLLQHMVAWLCLLQHGNITVRAERFQPRLIRNRHIPYLANLLGDIVLADVAATPAAPPVQSERQHPRILQLHYLAELAGLTSVVHGILLPGPAAHTWLHCPPVARAQTLLAPLLADTPNAASLWHGYQLPGWQSFALGFSFGSLWAALHAAGPAGIAAKRLARQVPVTVITNEAEQQPVILTQSWLDLLSQLGGVTNTTRGRYRVVRKLAANNKNNPATAHLPAQPPAPTLMAAWQDPALDTLKVTATTNTADQDRFELSAWAQLSNLSPHWTWLLDRSAAQRAFQRGRTAAQLLGLLAHRQGAPLRPGLAKTLRRWEREANDWQLCTGTLLMAKDPQKLAVLLQRRTIRECIAQTLSPRAVLLQVNKQASLLRRLKRLNILPMQPPAWPLTPATSPANPFEQAIVAHCYVAARLGHALPELSTLSYRTPWAVLEQLAKQLTPHDLASAEQLIQRLISERPTDQSAIPDPAYPAEDDELISLERQPQLAAWLSLIQTAIPAAHALHIRYYSASSDRESQRVIEPMRIETRGTLTYIVAFCRQAQSERLFRLDRIRALWLEP